MPENKDFPSGPKPKRTWYPWKEWADGEVRKFVRGEDFVVSPYQFSTAAKRMGGRHGWEVKAVVDGDSVFLRITPPKTKKKTKVVRVKVVKK